jgi:hypothetical protein
MDAAVSHVSHVQCAGCTSHCIPVPANVHQMSEVLHEAQLLSRSDNFVHLTGHRGTIGTDVCHVYPPRHSVLAHARTCVWTTCTYKSCDKNTECYGIDWMSYHHRSACQSAQSQMLDTTNSYVRHLDMAMIPEHLQPCDYALIHWLVHRCIAGHLSQSRLHCMAASQTPLCCMLAAR